MADPTRETRTMVLCALPYPPLPVDVQKMQADCMMTEQDLDVTTTHSLLAQCMNACVIRNDDHMNNVRKSRQVEVLQGFLHALATEGFELKDEALYHFYCKYTLKHISTYFDDNCPPDVRFKPYSYMTVGDKSHAKLVEYAIAQGILFEENQTEEQVNEIKKMNLNQLLLLIMKRMGESQPLS